MLFPRTLRYPRLVRKPWLRKPVPCVGQHGQKGKKTQFLSASREQRPGRSYVLSKKLGWQS